MKEGPRGDGGWVWRACAPLRIGVARRGGPLWGKGSGVSWPPRMAAHREEQEQDKINFGSAYQDNNLVFCQPNGAFYSPDHVGTRTKTLLRKAGFPKFSLHSLRHSHASILLSNGTPLAVVSERLGHIMPIKTSHWASIPTACRPTGKRRRSYGTTRSPRSSPRTVSAKARKI